MDPKFGPRRPSRPRLSASESEAYFNNADVERTCMLKPSQSSGFFFERSPSSGSTDQAYHLQQCENVIKSHHKLKVYFTVLFVVNVILVIIVIILIMFCVFFLMMARDAESKNTENYGGHRSEMLESSCPIKCKDLNSYGFDIPAYQECCSLDNVVQAITKKIDKINQSRPRLDNIVPSSKPRLKRPVIHLVGGTPASETKDNTHYVEGWQKQVNQKIDFDVNDKNDVIKIPENGLYFIYSRIHFTLRKREQSGRTHKKIQMPVTHALFHRRGEGGFSSIQNSRLKCSMHNDSSVVHSSYLENIAYFRERDEIKIGLTYAEKLEYENTKTDNYFGMFKL